jgi:hypothetical protein
VLAVVGELLARDLLLLVDGIESDVVDWDATG